jgi:hypothetical protein
MNLTMRGSPSHGLAVRHCSHPKGIPVFRRHTFDPFPWLLGLVAVGVVGLIVWLVAITPGPNYAGTGNRFDITATVTDITDESVLIDNVSVQYAEGEATDWFTTGGGWFDSNHLELHDHYYTDEWTNSKHHTGTLFDQGTPITLKDLHRGDVIHATGRIRASHSGKSNPDRAVFDLIEVTH